MVDLSSLTADPAALGALMGLIAAFFVVFLVVGIALWVYTSLAFTAISKKAKLSAPAIAWIPFIGPTIQAFRASKMHWWPWLLIITFVIPLVNFVTVIIFSVYGFIWTWKLFEKAKQPGWWALVPIGTVIPMVGMIFGLAYLVLMGIAAWGK